MNRPLDKHTYVVVDVETTGVSQMDRICEIGLTRITDGKISDKLETLIHPQVNITNTIFHGIQDWMVQDAPAFGEVAAEIAGFIDQTVLIAHNAPFDMRFLRYEFQRLDTDLSHRALCTLKISRKIHLDYPSHKLDYLLEQYGIVNDCPHRAGADADSEAELFLEMREKMQEQGIKTLEDFSVWGLPYEHFWCDEVKVRGSGGGRLMTRDDL